MTISCTTAPSLEVAGRFSIGTATAIPGRFRRSAEGLDRAVAGICGAMTSRCLARVCLGLLAALALLPATTAVARADGPRLWLTTGDQANLLAEQPSDALGPPAADA